MRRILIVAAIVLFGWFALKDWAYGMMLGTAEIAPETPDYYYDAVWLDRPDEAPAGGWEEPWGVDLFIIAPPVSTPVRAGLIPANSEHLKAEYEAMLQASGLSTGNLSIYAPGYRSPSPASDGKVRDEAMDVARQDIKEAMKRYLSAENRLRGLVILAAPDSEPLLKAALKQLPETIEFRERFGGVMLPSGKRLDLWSEPTGPCSPAFDSCTVEMTLEADASNLAWLTPSLPRTPRHYASDPGLRQTLETRMQTLSNWLDLNADKPAEPFDTWAADEVVDVAPIRRPNAEEDISGERGD